MYRIVQWLGGIIAAFGVFIVGVLVYYSSGEFFDVLRDCFLGSQVIFAGALLFSVGSIVENLVAIRVACERQNGILYKLGNEKAGYQT